jgi:hypothetical protein
VGPQCTLCSYGTFSGSEYCQCDSFKIRRLIDLADRRTNHKIRQRSRQATARMLPSVPRPNSPAGRERTQTAQRTRARRALRGPNATRRSPPHRSSVHLARTPTPVMEAVILSFAHGLRYLTAKHPSPFAPWSARSLGGPNYTPRTGVQSPDRAINIQNYNGA